MLKYTSVPREKNHLRPPSAFDGYRRASRVPRRYTRTSAMDRYPLLTNRCFEGLDFDVARRPKRRKHETSSHVRTYLPADVDAIAARQAAYLEPEPVDPLWLEVLDGRRYTATTAMKRYPQLYKQLFKPIPFDIARKPSAKTAKGGWSCDVKTFLAADIDALAAERLARKKRPRRAPQGPEREP